MFVTDKLEGEKPQKSKRKHKKQNQEKVINYFTKFLIHDHNTPIIQVMTHSVEWQRKSKMKQAQALEANNRGRWGWISSRMRKKSPP